MSPNVPEDVHWLVTERLPEMDHVDALLFLVRADGTPRSIADILAETTISASAVDGVLRHLIDKGLVIRKDVGGEVRFVYQPEGMQARLAVESLTRMYEMRPVSLIRFIYERPPVAAKLFADAFRLRKPSP